MNACLAKTTSRKGGNLTGIGPIMFDFPRLLMGGGGGLGLVFGSTKGTKTTKHGNERLKERGFSNSDISYTKNTTNIKTQSDGAKVYIKEISSGKFNIIVEGDRGIITAIKNIGQKSLNRLMKNYKWR